MGKSLLIKKLWLVKVETKTWKRRIVEVMQRDPKKWRTRNQIIKILGLTWRDGDEYGIGRFIHRLVEQKVLEKVEISQDLFKRDGFATKYAFRLSGKSFKEEFGIVVAWKGDQRKEKWLKSVGICS